MQLGASLTKPRKGRGTHLPSYFHLPPPPTPLLWERDTQSQEMLVRAMKRTPFNLWCPCPHSSEITIVQTFAGQLKQHSSIAKCHVPKKPGLGTPSSLVLIQQLAGQTVFPADTPSMCPHLFQATGSYSGDFLWYLWFQKRIGMPRRARLS